MDAFVTVGALGAAVVGLLLTLAVALLLVPIEFAAEGIFTERRVDALAEAGWGFGLARVQASPRGGVVVTLFGRATWRLRTATSSARTPSKGGGPARRGRWPGARFVWRVLRRAGRSLRLRARVRGRLGTGDPSATATVHGALVAARGLIRGLDTSDLRIDWMEPTIDLEGRLHGRVWPAAIVWIVASEYANTRWSHRAREVTP